MDEPPPAAGTAVLIAPQIGRFAAKPVYSTDAKNRTRLEDVMLQQSQSRNDLAESAAALTIDPWSIVTRSADKPGTATADAS
jgi:hypothetical protein